MHQPALSATCTHTDQSLKLADNAPIDSWVGYTAVRSCIIELSKVPKYTYVYITRQLRACCQGRLVTAPRH